MTVGDKSQSQMNSLPDDVTYILGGLTMEGTLEGGEHPVVVDGQFKGNITANEIILAFKVPVIMPISRKINTMAVIFPLNWPSTTTGCSPPSSVPSMVRPPRM
jgi:hypothetical protein